MTTKTKLRVALTSAVSAYLAGCALGALPGTATVPARFGNSARSPSAAEVTSPPPGPASGRLTAQRRIQDWLAQAAPAGEREVKNQGRFAVGSWVGSMQGSDGLPVAVGGYAIATAEGVLSEDLPCNAADLLLADLDGDGRQDLLISLQCADQGRGPESSAYIVADRASGPVSIPLVRTGMLLGCTTSSRLGRKLTLDVTEQFPCMVEECTERPTRLTVYAWNGSELEPLASAEYGKLEHQPAPSEADNRCSLPAKKGGTVAPWAAFSPEGQAVADKCKCAPVQGKSGLYCCPFAPEGDADAAISDCPKPNAKVKKTEKNAEKKPAVTPLRTSPPS